MIRVVIADDERLIREGLRSDLEALGDFQIAGEACDGSEALQLIDSLRPDAVFLDVAMPGKDGIALARELNPAHLPLVVFLTAYDEFAVEAFAVNALDYLLKPYTLDRLAACAQRIGQRMQERDTGEWKRKLESFIEQRDRRWLERIAARTGERFDLVDVRHVDWIKSADNYAEIHARGRTYLVRETLSELERKLNPDVFLRVHRGYLVNVSSVLQVHPLLYGEYELRLTDGAAIPTGRTYKDAVAQRLLG